MIGGGTRASPITLLLDSSSSSSDNNSSGEEEGDALFDNDHEIMNNNDGSSSSRRLAAAPSPPPPPPPPPPAATSAAGGSATANIKEEGGKNTGALQQQKKRQSSSSSSSSPPLLLETFSNASSSSSLLPPIKPNNRKLLLSASSAASENNNGGGDGCSGSGSSNSSNAVADPPNNLLKPVPDGNAAASAVAAAKTSGTSTSAAAASATTAPPPKPSKIIIPKTCWKCSVPLELSSLLQLEAAAAAAAAEFSNANNDEKDNDTNNDEKQNQQNQQQVCLYECHTHPHLNVPICSVCSDEVLATAMMMDNTTNKSDNKKKKSNSNSNDDSNSKDDDDNDEICFCYGCGESDKDKDGFVLFLCDTPGCSHAYCDDCVARAYSDDGRKVVEKLINSSSSNDEKWFCLKCQPTQHLQDIQQSMLLSQTEDNNNGSNETSSKASAAPSLLSPETPASSSTSPKQQHSRPLEVVVEELKIVEDAHKQCIDDLDNEDEVRKQIAEELGCNDNGDNNNDADDDDTAVDDELNEWKDLLLKHQARLADKITHLQDELELQHRVDVRTAYQDILQLAPKAKLLPTTNNSDDDDNDDDNDNSDDDEPEDPAWVRKANKAIEKREKKIQKQQAKMPPKPKDPPPSSSSTRLHNEENYDDVEELAYNSSSEEEEETSELVAAYSQCATAGGWRRLGPPSPGRFEEALENENNMLQQMELSVQIVPDKDDRRANLREERACSSKQGTRRDAIAVVAARRKRQQQQQKRRQTPKRITPQRVAGTAGAGSTNNNNNMNNNKKPAAASRNKKAGSTNNNNNKMELSPSSPFAPPTGGGGGGAAAGAVALPNQAVRRKKKNRRSSADSNTQFSDSSLVLCDPSMTVEQVDNKNNNGDGSNDEDAKKKKIIRTVTVAKPLAGILKPHQVDGVKFLWRCTFSDCNYHEEVGDSSTSEGGCILAHNMGLGKSLTTITLLHTALNHPSLVSRHHHNNPVFHSVAVIVPVNTLTNWEAEVQRWTGDLDSPLVAYNLSQIQTHSREAYMEQWKRGGGLLLLGVYLFTQIAKNPALFKLLQPDILVLDEAHTMLKNSNTQVYKKLQLIQTKRRILLTGTPLQNNVSEYFRMVEFARKGLIGPKSESEFERVYRIPIEKGLPSDARPGAVYDSLFKMNQLKQIIDPIVDRKDATELRKELPHMQQAVLHLRPTRLQTRLLNFHKRLQKSEPGFRNFFRIYQNLKPVYNHPACLKMASTKNKSPRNSPTSELDDEIQVVTLSEKWWEDVLKPSELENLDAVENSSKVILLLHILAYSFKVGDKVLVFSNCLKTLDFIEHVLGLPDWKVHVKSLSKHFPGLILGGLQKDIDFVRIDGGTASGTRGSIVSQFNDKDANTARVFLISSVAGGIGINLHTANRVVLFDSHFNPSIATQCLFRAYRYGQEKEVFCYRLLTEGTMEEKIYARSVNKSGVALRVLDGKSYNRCFSENELADLSKDNNWIQCDLCDKWRMLIHGEDPPAEDQEWYCGMNQDTRCNDCEKPERDDKWYFLHDTATAQAPGPAAASVQSSPAKGSSAMRSLPSTPIKCIAAEPEGQESSVTGEAASLLLNKDPLLQHLINLNMSKPKKGGESKVVSRHYFHEALLDADTCCQDELEKLRNEMESDKKEGGATTASAPAPQDTSKKDAGAKMASASLPKVGGSSPTTPDKNRGCDAPAKKEESSLPRSSPGLTDRSGPLTRSATKSRPERQADDDDEANGQESVREAGASNSQSKSLSLRKRGKTSSTEPTSSVKKRIFDEANAPKPLSSLNASSPKKRGSPDSSSEDSSPRKQAKMAAAKPEQRDPGQNREPNSSSKPASRSQQPSSSSSNSDRVIYDSDSSKNKKHNKKKRRRGRSKQPQKKNRAQASRNVPAAANNDNDVIDLCSDNED